MLGRRQGKAGLELMGSGIKPPARLGSKGFNNMARVLRVLIALLLCSSGRCNTAVKMRGQMRIHFSEGGTHHDIKDGTDP